VARPACSPLLALLTGDAGGGLGPHPQPREGDRLATDQARAVAASLNPVESRGDTWLRRPSAARALAWVMLCCWSASTRVMRPIAVSTATVAPPSRDRSSAAWMNGQGLLHDIAANFLQSGQRDRGLAMLAALLRNDPADIWTCNFVAMFLSADLDGIARLAGWRALQLIDERGQEEQLARQIRNRLRELGEGASSDPVCDPRVLEELHASLAIDLAAGEHRPLSELSHGLLPELAAAPTKQPRMLSPFSGGRLARRPRSRGRRRR